MEDLLLNRQELPCWPIRRFDAASAPDPAAAAATVQQPLMPADFH
jgi:hypothetical protein